MTEDARSGGGDVGGAACAAPHVVAGGSGFLGQSLAQMLMAGGHRVSVLTRRIRPGLAGEQVPWDGARVGDWAASLDGASAVVNFTGRSVNCRYTETNRREILQSRLRSVRAIAAAIEQSPRPPAVWVQAASLAIYGDAGDRICDETAALATGFLAEVCC